MTLSEKVCKFIEEDEMSDDVDAMLAAIADGTTDVISLKTGAIDKQEAIRMAVAGAYLVGKGKLTFADFEQHTANGEYKILPFPKKG